MATSSVGSWNFQEFEFNFSWESTSQKCSIHGVKKTHSSLRSTTINNLFAFVSLISIMGVGVKPIKHLALRELNEFTIALAKEVATSFSKCHPQEAEDLLRPLPELMSALDMEFQNKLLSGFSHSDDPSDIKFIGPLLIKMARGGAKDGLIFTQAKKKFFTHLERLFFSTSIELQKELFLVGIRYGFQIDPGLIWFHKYGMHPSFTETDAYNLLECSRSIAAGDTVAKEISGSAAIFRELTVGSQRIFNEKDVFFLTLFRTGKGMPVCDAPEDFGILPSIGAAFSKVPASCIRPGTEIERLFDLFFAILEKQAASQPFPKSLIDLILILGEERIISCDSKSAVFCSFAKICRTSIKEIPDPLGDGRDYEKLVPLFGKFFDHLYIVSLIKRICLNAYLQFKNQFVVLACQKYSKKDTDKIDLFKKYILSFAAAKNAVSWLLPLANSDECSKKALKIIYEALKTFPKHPACVDWANFAMRAHYYQKKMRELNVEHSLRKGFLLACMEVGSLVVNEELLFALSQVPSFFYKEEFFFKLVARVTAEIQAIAAIDSQEKAAKEEYFLKQAFQTSLVIDPAGEKLNAFLDTAFLSSPLNFPSLPLVLKTLHQLLEKSRSTFTIAVDCMAEAFKTLDIATDSKPLCAHYVQERIKKACPLPKDLQKFAQTPVFGEHLASVREIIEQAQKESDGPLKEPFASLSRAFIRFEQLKTMPHMQFEENPVTDGELFSMAFFIENTLTKVTSVKQSHFPCSETGLPRTVQVDFTKKIAYISAGSKLSFLTAKGRTKRVLGAVAVSLTSPDPLRFMVRGFTRRSAPPIGQKFAQKEIDLYKLLDGSPGVVRCLHACSYVSVIKGVAVPRTSFIFEPYESDAHAIVFVKCEGKELFSPKEMLWLIQDYVNGLDSIHKIGFIHGDIKPANLLFRKRSGKRSVEGAITDLGMAEKVGEGGAMPPTFAGWYNEGYYGSIYYTSPELHFGAQNFKGNPYKADLFALGICMYEFQTGQYPSWAPIIKTSHRDNFERATWKHKDLKRLSEDQHKAKEAWMNEIERNEKVQALFKKKESGDTLTIPEQYNWIMCALLLPEARRPSTADIKREIEQFIGSLDLLS